MRSQYDCDEDSTFRYRKKLVLVCQELIITNKKRFDGRPMVFFTMRKCLGPNELYINAGGSTESLSEYGSDALDTLIEFTKMQGPPNIIVDFNRVKASMESGRKDL